jgi:hypothetical protein
VWAGLALAVVLAVVLAGAFLAPSALGREGRRSPAWQRSRSVYRQLAGTRTVSAPTTILSAHITLARRDSVFVQSDGTYIPGGSSAANVYIAVDGRKVSNDSLVDWRTSALPTAHPFDAVGALPLPAGRHLVELIAEPPSLPLCAGENCTPSGPAASGGSFTVAAGASLSVLVHPATRVSFEVTGNDAGPFDLTTAGLLTEHNRLVGPLPWVQLLSATVPRGARAVAFGSGWLYAAGHGGDGMLSLLVDGRFPGNAVASWANQDTWPGAESRGPLSTQAFLSRQARPRTISLATVELPWAPSWGLGGEDPLIYSVAAGTELTVLTGGMALAGSATGDSTNSPNASGVWVGSSTGDPSSPPVGTPVELASGRIRVPRGDSGVVMLSAKSRTHGGDNGVTGSVSHGTISLWLTIDGKQVGSRVFQEIETASSGSQRSIAVSYLAAGRHALRPGSHRVAVWGRADGSFVHAYMWRDLPLVWFD